MKILTVQRSVLVLLCGLVLLVIGSFTMVLSKTYREYKHFLSREYAYQHQLVELRAEVRQREKYLNGRSNSEGAGDGLP